MDIFVKSQPKMTDNCLTIHSDVLFIDKIIITAGKSFMDSQYGESIP